VASSSEVAVFCELRAAGASVAEAAEVIELARAVDATVIELAAAAYLHERRDTHGRWAGGMHTTGRLVPMTHEQAKAKAASRVAARRAEMAEVAKSVAQEHHQKSLKVVAHAQEQTAFIAHEEARAQVSRLGQQVKARHQQYVEESTKAADETEKKKAHTKFFAVMGSLLGGTALGWVASKTGAPDAAVIAASVGPAALEALFERQKRL
jgi:hypothetical protein